MEEKSKKKKGVTKRDIIELSIIVAIFLVIYVTGSQAEVFINIWATWCPPCVAEMPNINSLYNKIENKDDIVFLMISHDDEMKTARTWIKRKGFDFPVYKLASPLPDVFETGVVPSTFVVSPEGKIVVSKTGMANYDTKRFKKYLLKLAEK